jgi:hypothetical protein
MYHDKKKNKCEVLRFAVTKATTFKWGVELGIPEPSITVVYINEREKKGWESETWQL